MIIVKNDRFLEARDELSPKCRVQGFFKIVAHKIDGRSRVVADWFPNLILNQGLDRIGVGGAYSVCRVGSGTGTPAVTDTALQAPVGISYAITTQTQTQYDSPSWHSRIVRTWRFNPGEADGNLSEVGVGTPTILFSRARILDLENNPTTITILPEEYLDVTYELRHYAPTSDVLQTINISGINYDVIVRGSAINSTPWLGSSIPSNGAGNPIANIYSYTGNIGTNTSSPSGTQVTGGTLYNPLTYAPGSYQNTYPFQLGLGTANIGGIRSFYLSHVMGAWQTQFTPVIPKDSTKVLNMQFNISWSRYTP